MSRHVPGSPSSTPLQRGASLSPAMSSPRSNRSSFSSPISSSPYTSHPRLSIRTPRMGQPAPTILDHLVAPLKRGRSRRLVLLLAFASFVGLLVWRSSEDLAGPAANEDRACRLLPWLQRCIGTGSHPLDLIHFERSGGYMFYPGHNAPTAAVDTAVEEDGAPPVDEIPPQPHPIHLLMDRARRDWDKKLARQSKTLREAVEEYEHRYGRRPPKGFGEWYWFAKGVDFVMIDEFNALDENIKPFLALPPSILRERSEKIQFDKKFWIHDKTFTVRLAELGRIVDAHGPMVEANERPDQMLKLLGGLAKYMPDMNITVTGHDVPWVVLSGEHRANLNAKSEAGAHVSAAEAEDVQDDWAWDGWARACPPNSALRSVESFDNRIAKMDDWVASPPSFIHDHVATMSMCDHPERSNLHGFTAWPGPRPGLLYPLFTFTKTVLHSDLLLPPIDQYDRPLGKDPAWEEKKSDRVIWRGTTTGALLDIPHMRKWSQRPRLCRLPYQEGNLTLTYAPNDKPGQLGPTETMEAPAADLGLEYFDFRFLGSPLQCTDPVACKAFEKEFLWDDWMDESTQNDYKYVIDVDGNGWSGRFHRLMSSNSLVLKSTIFPEWYQDHIQAWLHYVPIATDFSDLWSTMAFFRGDLDGRGAHDDLAKEIAAAGKKWTAEHWRWQDMQVYLYRLLLEYARIMLRDDNNPNSMDM